jgi:BlaI family transcriptional regulator, penicillinase repressor
MDIVHELGEATVAEIRERMQGAPSNGAVRSVLRILVEKEHLVYEERGPRYVYSAAAPRGQAGRSALRHVLQTFFGGSVEGAMATLLELEDTKLTDEERARVQGIIERAAEEGR